MSVLLRSLCMIFGVCSGVLAIVARCVTIYSLDIISNIFVLFRLIYLDGLNIFVFLLSFWYNFVMFEKFFLREIVIFEYVIFKCHFK